MPMERLIGSRIVPVIRAGSLDEALYRAEACLEGGISTLEITFSFADTEKAIKTLSTDKDVTIGAGTVLSLEHAQSALDAGAQFIVSPHTDEKLIEFSQMHGLISVAGASTSNEIVRAHQMGSNFVKIFPAKIIGGTEYIKAIKEPLPFINIFVTGGIDKSNIVDYLRAGASVLGISSALFQGVTHGEKRVIRKRAEELTELIKSANENEES